MNPTGTRLAQAQVKGHLRIDAIYQDLADAVEAEVARRAVTAGDGAPRLPLAARGAVLVAVGGLLDGARWALAQAITESRQDAIAAAEYEHEPLRQQIDTLQAWNETYRALETDRASVLGQTGAILARGIAANIAATVIARQVRQYFAPWFAARRDATGTLRRADRQGAIQHWPGQAGMASQHVRLVMLYQTTWAHGRVIRSIAARDRLDVRWNLSYQHQETDICDQHARRDVGLGPGIYPFDDAPPVPQHPRCFPAGVAVSGPVAIASTDRWYEGDLVEIVTAGGLHLPVTPNHPILTPQGWVAAGLLQVGDDVVRNGLSERVSAQVHPDEQQIPALIENVARALGGALAVPAIRVPTTAVDFHGDGIDGEVCVVRADRFLHGGLDTTIRQPALHQEFAGAGVELTGFAGGSSLTPHLEAVGLAALGSMSGFGVGQVLLGAALPDHEAIGVRAASDRYSALNQAPANCATTDAQRDRNTALGLSRQVARADVRWQNVGALPDGRTGNGAAPAQDATALQLIAEALGADAGATAARRDVETGFVQLDRIIQIERRQFAGHVYNLETRDGWYIANGIIVHNCRCYYSTVERETGVQAQTTWEAA